MTDIDIMEFQIRLNTLKTDFRLAGFNEEELTLLFSQGHTEEYLRTYLELAKLHDKELSKELGGKDYDD